MILVNGKQCDTVPVLDRGLSYGDGVFETLLIVRQTPVLLAAHLARLQKGCAVLGIDPPESARIAEQVQQLASTCSASCVAKIIVTRGLGTGGYAANRANSSATLIVMTHDLPVENKEWAQSGIDACLCRYRMPLNPCLAGIKHLNRLDQVIARSEWNDEFQEGLVLDLNGSIIEGTMSNVFVQLDEQLYTPDLSQCGVAGIMRDHILELCAELSVPARVTILTMDDLNKAESLFFCNSVRGIWPVKNFNGRAGH